MKDAHVYVVHGYMASTQSHWFPWLKTQVQNQGGQLNVLNLPDSNKPKAAAWNRVLKAGIENPNERTFIVAHSLGCITALHFLSELPKTTRLGGFICVSGFSERLPNIPSINEFNRKKYDIARVKEIAPKRAVVVANDDTIVAPDFTKRLAKELEAPLHTIEKGGHFLDADGFIEFPLILEELEKMNSRSR